MDNSLQARYREYVTSGGRAPFEEWQKGAQPATTWPELLAARNAPGADQAVVGPQEHEAYAYEYGREHPFMNLPVQMATIPGYSLAKLAGLAKGRSGPSLAEMAAGYDGMWRAFMQNLQGLR